ncbi:MAG: threonylcarbamoyl-AMP synthase [Treponema sp.]|jgi:L-threonylcarbamoyladenylate synthase|nr:threonylcarbamoyl-AMP synthase [Treponema sp.]
MRLLSDTDADISLAAQSLKAGGLVAFPTETVYGLGADAFNPSAVARIFEAKKRPYFDPLIIHIAGTASLERIACLSTLDATVLKKIEILTDRLWPGPLTLILPKSSLIPDIATSGLKSLALRFPAHPVARKLISLSTGAVAAPSANRFGCLSPTRAAHVREQLEDGVDFIIDGGRTGLGLESTILDLCSGPPRILRPGGCAREAIEELIGRVEVSPTPGTADPSAAESEAFPPRPSAPGLLKSHYAPRTPLAVYAKPEMIAAPPEAGAACLFFDGASRDAWLARYSPLPAPCPVYTLSETGDTLEAAAVLFDMLHSLDHLSLKAIRAELAPEVKLGPAINDRLIRAAAR